MNVILRGAADKKLNKMIKQGYANTKSEAIRLAILSFNETSLSQLSEEELVTRKLDRIDKEIAEGKSRLLSDKEAFGKYSKYLKGKNIKG